jgi:hypothetical protein
VGTIANGWDKAIVVFDENGKFVARRIVRLRVSEDGELFLMKERTYGSHSENSVMDEMLARVAKEMGVRYQPDYSSKIETVKFRLWRGHSQWDYSDSYGRQFPGQVGLIEIKKGDDVKEGEELVAELNMPLVVSDSQENGGLLGDRIKEEEYRQVAFLAGTRDGKESDAQHDGSVPQKDFIEVGGDLYYRGVIVNLVSIEQLESLDAEALEVEDGNWGVIYLDREGSLYRVEQTEDALGGIDFNPAHLNLITEGEKLRIKFQVDPKTIQHIQIDGLTPVIINISPVLNPLMLLGLEDEEEASDLLAKLSDELLQMV